jgi:hypothetical protein
MHFSFVTQKHPTTSCIKSELWKINLQLQLYIIFACIYCERFLNTVLMLWFWPNSMQNWFNILKCTTHKNYKQFFHCHYFSIWNKSIYSSEYQKNAFFCDWIQLKQGYYAFIFVECWVFVCYKSPGQHGTKQALNARNQQLKLQF